MCMWVGCVDVYLWWLGYVGGVLVCEFMGFVGVWVCGFLGCAGIWVCG